MTSGDTDEGSGRRSTSRLLLSALVVGLAYAALSKLVIEVTSLGATTGATFWPGAGLTVAVLLVRPRREWPYFLVAVGIAELLMDVTSGFTFWVGVGWALANTIEPTISARLLTRRGRRAPDLARRHDFARFLAAAVVAGPLVGALVGTAVAALLIGDPWWPRLPRWFVGDGIGVLVVAPLLIVVLSGAWRLPSKRAAWTLALLAVVSVVALGPWEFAGEVGLPFLVIPVLVLVAVTLRTPGAAVGVLFVAMMVEIVTAAGEGPFAGDSALHGLVVAQMFVAMNAVTAFTVAALMSDIVSRTELERTLRNQALHDSLTGVANRRLLFDRLEVASARLERSPGLVTLLYVDLDGFKAVNDVGGHAAGDAVLVETARRLESVVRSHDTVARIGGDEFVVLATDLVGIEDASRLAQRVMDSLERPFSWHGQPIRIRASVGIAATNTPLPDLDRFLSSADRAMYRAKAAGGGRIGSADVGATFPTDGLGHTPKPPVR